MDQPTPNNDYLQVPEATQERSYNKPSPPRIFVPPPLLTPISQNLDFVQKVKDFESNPWVGAEFLKTVTYGNFKMRDHVLDWRYEERRSAQEILPFLLLGPVGVTRDRTWLQSNGITMVVGVRDMHSAQANLLAPRTPGELGIRLVNIDIKSTAQLIAVFPEAIATINAHLSEQYQLHQAQNHHTQHTLESSTSTPGRILVFCESGNDRSATLVAAYIMAMYSVDMVTAIQIVQSQRFCVSVDDHLKWTLRSYQDILTAKRDVANAASQMSNRALSNGQAPVSSSSLYVQVEPSKRERKRSVERVYDEEGAMTDASDGGSDMAQEVKREGSAPFSA